MSVDKTERGALVCGRRRALCVKPATSPVKVLSFRKKIVPAVGR